MHYQWIIKIRHHIRKEAGWKKRSTGAGGMTESNRGCIWSQWIVYTYEIENKVTTERVP